MLDAGVALLVEGGLEAFTIAAVCERAQVVPRSIYARAETKDALLLAVYERGIARVVADHVVFADDDHWRGMTAAELVRTAVREVTELFARHAALLGAVIVVARVYPEVHRRGAHYTQLLGNAFTSRVLCAREEITQPDPETAVWACFNTVYSAGVVRVLYGPGFVTPAFDEDTFQAGLAAMSACYLLGSRTRQMQSC